MSKSGACPAAGRAPRRPAWLRGPAASYLGLAMSHVTCVVSDVHLGGVPAENDDRFLDFLAAVPDRADALVIAGDLFDFWFEYRTVVPREHFGVLRRLADVVDAGVDVRMIGGNHDAWGGRFLSEQVGLEWLEAPVVTEISGRTAYLAHGDGLAGGDWGYRAVKRVLRSEPARRAFRALHPDLADRLIRVASRTPEREAGEPEQELERARALSEHAAGLLRGHPGLELVVFGHAHRPEIREVEPGRHYLNPGDWIHSFSYGLVTPDGIRLEEWDAPDARS